MVSMRRIADLAEVSVAAVSRTLSNIDGTIRISDATRARIFQIARETHYRPNDDIGFFLEDIVDEQFLLYSRAFLGAQRSIYAIGGRLIASPIEPEEDKVPDQIESWKIGGAIFIHRISPSVRDALALRNMPYVIINPIEEEDHNTLLCDDIYGMECVLEHLEKRGHRRVAFFMPAMNHPSYFKRTRVYREWMAKGGEEPIEVRSEFESPSLRSELEEGVRRGATAYIVYEALYPTVLAMLARLSGDAIPEIVTINDAFSYVFYDAPSSLRIPVYQMGSRAVEMIRTMWDRQSATCPPETIKPEFIHRERGAFSPKPKR